MGWVGGKILNFFKSMIFDANLNKSLTDHSFFFLFVTCWASSVSTSKQLWPSYKRKRLTFLWVKRLTFVTTRTSYVHFFLIVGVLFFRSARTWDWEKFFLDLLLSPLNHYWIPMWSTKTSNTYEDISANRTLVFFKTFIKGVQRSCIWNLFEFRHWKVKYY